MRISDWSSDVCSSDLLDATACGEIGFAPHEARLGVVRLDGAVQDSPADVVGIVAVVGAAHLGEDAGLAVAVGGAGVSLRTAARDLTGVDGTAHHRAQDGQADAHAGPAGDRRKA